MEEMREMIAEFLVGKITALDMSGKWEKQIFLQLNSSHQ